MEDEGKIKAYKYVTKTYTLEKMGKQSVMSFNLFYFPEYKKEIKILTEKTTNDYFKEKSLEVINVTDETANIYDSLANKEIHEIYVDKKWMLDCFELYENEQKLDTLKNLLYLKSPNVESLEESSNKLFKKGLDYFNSKNYEDAKKYFLQCIEILKNTTALINKSYSYYNIACCYSLQQNIDEAIKWLNLAFENGYIDWVHIITDIDFLKIRNDERFVNLIKEIKEKNPNRSKNYINVGPIINPVDSYLQKHSIE